MWLLLRLYEFSTEISRVGVYARASEGCPLSTLHCKSSPVSLDITKGLFMVITMCAMAPITAKVTPALASGDGRLLIPDIITYPR